MGGAPAKKIGVTNDLVCKRKMESMKFPKGLKVDECWKLFYESRVNSNEKKEGENK